MMVVAIKNDVMGWMEDNCALRGEDWERGRRGLGEDWETAMGVVGGIGGMVLEKIEGWRWRGEGQRVWVVNSMARSRRRLGMGRLE